MLIFLQPMVRIVIFIWAVLTGLVAGAQTVEDSLRPQPQRQQQPARPAPRRTAAPVIPDTVQRDTAFVFETLPNVRRDTITLPVSTTWQSDTFRYTAHPYFTFTNPARYTVSVRQWQGKEPIFYTLVAMLIFFAAIRNGFGRYIQDLFKTFFRTTVRQRQMKEQLMQSPLPSLLLNIFYLFSIGMFLALLLQHLQRNLPVGFWLLYLYCVAGVLMIYAVKFVTLKCMGWIFQVSEAMDTYIFIVFTTNKVIGIALLPCIIVLGFTYGIISQAALTLGIIVVIGLFAYRYFLSFVSIHRQVKISFFHFLLYLCAFEIAPLLLINKLLFRFLGETS